MFEDALVMCDVLEHFDNEKGRSLIEKLLTKTPCLVIITLYYWLVQCAVFEMILKHIRVYVAHRILKCIIRSQKKIGFTFIAVLTNSKSDLNMAKIKKDIC